MRGGGKLDASAEEEAAGDAVGRRVAAALAHREGEGRQDERLTRKPCHHPHLRHHPHLHHPSPGRGRKRERGRRTGVGVSEGGGESSGGPLPVEARGGDDEDDLPPGALHPVYSPGPVQAEKPVPTCPIRRRQGIRAAYSETGAIPSDQMAR